MTEGQHNDRDGAPWEPLMEDPDGGRQVRTPEFYRARAKVQQAMANEAKALASQHEGAALGYRNRAARCESNALLMEQWADEAEAKRGSHTEDSRSAS